MKRHVSLVLIPLDDYTRQVITGNYIKPWVECENEPLWKPGYYIFMDMKQKKFMLHVESHLYQEQTLCVMLEEGKTKVLKLKLVPSEKYAVRKDAVVVCGIAQPGKYLDIYSDEIKQRYKLLKDYKSGEKIGIYHPKEKDLSGKRIWIKGRKESFRTVLGEQSDEENYYEIDGPSTKLRKVETDIFLGYNTIVRENGTFYLLFPVGKEAVFQAVLLYEEKKIEVTLQSKKMNYFDLS